MSKLGKWCLLLCVYFGHVDHAFAATASGTIAYPDSVDVSNLIERNFTIRFREPGEFLPVAQTTVKIPTFGRSVAWQINTIPDTPTDTSYIIEYLSGPLSNSPVFDDGFWTSSGTVLSEGEAEGVTVLDDLTSIDFELLARPRYGMTINLSKALAANAFFSSGLGWQNDAGTEFSGYGTNDQIIAGETQITTSGALDFQTEGGYIARAACNSNCENLVREVFWTSTGVVFEREDAELIPFDADLSNIVMDFPEGISMSGTFSLPPDFTPDPGITYNANIQAFAVDDMGNTSSVGGALAQIPPGSTSGDFEIALPPVTEQTMYKLRYSCNAQFCPALFEQGYYSTTGTVLNDSDATILFSDGNLSNLNFSFINGSTIFGTITLDPLGPDPTEDYFGSIGLNGYDGNGDFIEFYNGFFRMDFGRDDTFEFVIPANLISTFTINYACLNCPNYLLSAYLGEFQMRLDEASAKQIPIADIVNSINLTIPRQADSDADLIEDGVDNCPDIPNNDQTNLDQDQFGDACDDDLDGDTVLNVDDNCPETPNQDQSDIDNDEDGDLCDTDIDDDSFLNDEDNCPFVANPDQRDGNRNGVGDACDPIPLEFCWSIMTPNETVMSLCL